MAHARHLRPVPHPGPAWKQVDALLPSPEPHGSRQWRCEAEVAGRILRAQATRKQVFALVLPLLTADFIRPAEERRQPGKQRSAITQALRALKAGLDEDPATFVELQNVVEQCCTYYLREERFPTRYDELQPIPLLKTGLLTYAGDDGGAKGQAQRFRVDLEAGVAHFHFRCPDAQGQWAWRETETTLPLPPLLRERLAQGEAQAPSLREVRDADGTTYAALDIPVAVEAAPLPAWEAVERVLGVDWGVHTLLTTTALDAFGDQIGRPFLLNTGGFDGRQARTRRQIDELKSRIERLESTLLTLPESSAKAAWMTSRLLTLRRELARCWQKDERRNRALAHLASNALLVLAHVLRCALVAVESLTTRKTTAKLLGGGKACGAAGDTTGTIGTTRSYGAKSGAWRATSVVWRGCASARWRPSTPATRARAVASPPTPTGRRIDRMRWWSGAAGCTVPRAPIAPTATTPPQ